MKKWLILSGIVLLVGCTQSDLDSVPNTESPKEFEMSNSQEFSIKAPNEFVNRITRSDGSLALTTYDIRTTSRSKNDYASFIYFPLNIDCTANILGASETVDLSNVANGKWGRVNFWDGHGNEGWDPTGSEKIICNTDGTPTPSAVYVLCSQKNGKTVVACIRQTTDNPELAQQIFESFRWTK